MKNHVNLRVAILLVFSTMAWAQAARTASASSTPAAPVWHFAVSGDSRNCGDVVMPAIAAGAIRDQAEFYWHLGDLRAIYDFDQDFKQLATSQGKSLRIIDYENMAWDDFIQNQVVPFGSIPFFLGIGNHEVISPKTRGEFVAQFADWLNAPVVQQQRLKDDPADHRVKTYYHWIRDGVDFINLDNASHDQFDDDQMKWFETVVSRDRADSSIRTVVVGMHAALPESISYGHSMNEWAQGVESGRAVYQDLLKLKNDGHKNVYVLASHSHFFMDGTFNTEYWRSHGGVLPGWIVGTAGAVRAPLPPNAGDAKAAETNVYGYLLASVNSDGTIGFEYRKLSEDAIPQDVIQRYSSAFVHECFEGNRR
jgi:hypothetical protein